jgi:tetratricopeptide (TPR) repeat protein
MLGWLAYLDGRWELSVEKYRRADEIEPFTSKTNYQWALALMQLGRWSEAGKRFEQVLTIDPRHAGACQGLAHVLRKQGHLGKALGLARRAARLTRWQNPDVLITLAEIESDTGRFAEADKTAARALTVAEQSNPQMVDLIRQRQQEIRSRDKRGQK